MADIQKNKRRKKQSKENEFLIQGAILAAAAVIVKIIGALYRIPLTNIIGDEGNGFLGYAYEIYAMALMLSSFSLPIAVSKLVSTKMAMHQPRNAFRIFKCAMMFAVSVGAVVALAIFLGADMISRHLMESPLSVYTLKVLAPALFIVAVLGVMRGYFQGMGTMVPTAISQVLEQIINATVNIVGASIMIKVGMAAAKKQDNPLLEPAYGAAGGTAGTATGALVALLFLMFVFVLFQKVMMRQMRRDRTKHQDGYGQILKVLLLTIAPILFSTAIYKINQTIRLTMLIAIPCFVGFVVLASPIMQFLYGDSRTEPALMLASGAITVVLYSSSTVTNSILQGLDRLTAPAKNALISLGIHLMAVLVMLVVFKWGIYSLVFSNVIFSFCMCVLNMKDVYKASGFRQDFKTCYIKPFLAALIMGVAAFVSNKLLSALMPGRFLANGLSIIIAMLVYAVAVIRVGTLSESDMLALPMGGRILRVCKRFKIFPQERDLDDDDDIEYLD